MRKFDPAKSNAIQVLFFGALLFTNAKILPNVKAIQLEEGTSTQGNYSGRST